MGELTPLACSLAVAFRDIVAQQLVKRIFVAEWLEAPINIVSRR
jgi:hypothetical protein